MSDTSKPGESSSSSASANASSSTKANRVYYSSAAFLHHLHTDPSSYHISATPNRQGRVGPASNRSPRAATLPTELPSSTRATALVEPSNSLDVASLAAALPASPAEPNAGPSSSSSSSSRVELRRGTSRRGRPNTAPPGYAEAADLQPSLFTENETSPGSEHSEHSADYRHRLPLLSPQEELEQLSNADDSCIAALAREEVAGQGQAMDMIDLAAGGESATRLLGRAGQVGRQGGSPSTGSSRSAPSPERPGWYTFAQSYAHGLFDPIQIPKIPRSSDSPQDAPSASSSPGRRFAPFAAPPGIQLSAVDPPGSQGTVGSTSGSSGGTMSTGISSAPSTSASSMPSSVPSKSTMGSSLLARRKAFESASAPNSAQDTSARPDQLAIPTYSLAAATVRMASHNLRDSDFAPLAMPSPERELTDPLASVVSPDSGKKMHDTASTSDPGTTRGPLSRSMSSVVANTRLTGMQLPTIQASPTNTPLDHPSKGKGKSGSQSPYRESPPNHRGGIVVNNRIPPASAPLEKAVEQSSGTDYFGTVSPHSDKQHGGLSHSGSSQTVTQSQTPSAPKSSHEMRVSLSHGVDSFSTEPELPSPMSPQPPPPPPPTALPRDIGSLYETYGWLPAPLPPNELDRRRALYRFSVLHTASDINFDRIAHMTKLVFHTKIVLIALTDNDRQWHKSQSGLGVDEAARISSFCSHTVLSRSDEPFVVLDATKDWRFARNPQVVGPPFIRFYAGAPLRTTEGHNLGSLCIVDDKPRTEFPPRSRLILKEFAAITMREMELWRDKLQLRARDKIQTAMEKFTRECLEMDAAGSTSNADAAARMDQVYSRAAQLVGSTLDLDGCFILDIGQFEQTEIEGPYGKKTVYRADPYVTETASPVLERSDTFGPVNAFPVLASYPSVLPSRPLSPAEHEHFSEFLRESRDGRIFEAAAPSWIRYMFPSSMRFGMVVPVFGLNQQPFALICAFISKKEKQFLEGYELQFLRAIGVIILSAALRRRMVLADKAKSTLISSVSHELRTPLHGILAAAELLKDTQLDAIQQMFLTTVETCGKTLIETVNHVLDYTKLTGVAHAGSGGSAFKLDKVNLAQLVESTVEGSWIGQRARLFLGEAEVGSFYAPDTDGKFNREGEDRRTSPEVETVIDIGQREKGWMVKCEKGGLRRVLMNLVGNSLKFTSTGYIQVTLRELPRPEGSDKISVEMAVIDTGKGIGKDFLKDHLFHPFSQENPLLSGTGLGLSIVNSIVRSEGVNGKVDVWSSAGNGTEIRVSFDVEAIDDEEDSSSSASSASSITAPTIGKSHSLCLLGFDHNHRGQMLSLELASAYAGGWNFSLQGPDAEIILINQDLDLLHELRDSGKPLIFLQASRSWEAATAVRNNINNSGGFCHPLFKPLGPGALRKALRAAVEWLESRPDASHREQPSRELAESAEAQTPPAHVEGEPDRPNISRGDSGASQDSTSTISQESFSTLSDLSHKRFDRLDRPGLPLRRRSEEKEAALTRPTMAPRGVTYHAPRSVVALESPEADTQSPATASPTSSTLSTISLADGGVMLKAAVTPAEAKRKARVPRVMVVEDNVINRRVLGAFLKKKGFEYAEAVNGQEGVNLFERTPANHWDVILMDISMPVMNGHEATRAIRKIEWDRRDGNSGAGSPSVGPPLVRAGGGSDSPKLPSFKLQPPRVPPPPLVGARAKVFALTGLATNDDKREAFGSGVDGYLVKPVSLASLDLIFKKIGF